MRYKDIIREMHLSGHCSEADQLERSMREHHLSDWDHVNGRDDARDGLSIMSYSADCAERAYDDLRYRQMREEREAREQHEQDERAEEIRQQRIAQELEEYWQSQVPPQEQQQEDR